MAVHTLEPASDHSIAESLLAHLNELLACYTELNEQARAKLEAIRQAQSDRLHQVAIAESAFVDQLTELRRRGQALIAQAAQRLHAPGLAAGPLRALAARLPAADAAEINEKSAAVRAAAEKLRDSNGLAMAVARRLQSHLRAIFEEVASFGSEALPYGKGGVTRRRAAANWLDAVG